VGCDKMYTLFIDTHSELIKIILFKDGKILTDKEKKSSMQHSVYTMPLIDEVLKENNINSNDLNEIIVVNGPGSFTGVRIGVTIAKTMAYLLNIPIKVINTLEMKAVMINDNSKIVVEEEKNGKYIAKYDQNNNLVGEYLYLKNSEFETYAKENKISYVDNINYETIYNYLEQKEAINPHAVNPLYIKVIEALK
jgi:tRNA threonylcarbamoyl adenosine modification protein YeaZ